MSTTSAILLVILVIIGCGLLVGALSSLQPKAEITPKPQTFTQMQVFIIIKDTLNLSDMYASEGVLDELENRDDIEIISGLCEIRFDDNNRIITDL